MDLDSLLDKAAGRTTSDTYARAIIIAAWVVAEAVKSIWAK